MNQNNHSAESNYSAVLLAALLLGVILTASALGVLGAAFVIFVIGSLARDVIQEFRAHSRK